MQFEKQISKQESKIRMKQSKKCLEEQVGAWEKYLHSKELSSSSIKKYTYDVRRFLNMCGEDISLDVIHNCREKIFAEYMLSSANAMILSVNQFMRWIDEDEYVMRLYRAQTAFDDDILPFADYKELLEFTKSTGRSKMHCIIRVLATTGMRIGELKFVTVETVRQRKIQVYNKGKSRKIYLTEDVANLIEEYCKEKNISRGVVFYGRYEGAPITPSAVWQNLQRIANLCGIEERYAHPHSFRHLFAKMSVF